MRHNVWLGVHMLAKRAVDLPGRLTMYTLTYGGGEKWQPLHLRTFTQWLRRQGQRFYVWVAELQKRGAVHYHYLTILPEGERWTKPSPKNGGWSHGFTWVTPDIERPLYIMKYLQKQRADGQTHHFPKGLRLYCVSRNLIVQSEFEHQYDWRDSHLPHWSRDDEKTNLDRLSSRRCLGGVSYRGLVEYSPFARSAFPCADNVREVMKRNFGKRCMLAAPSTT